MENQGPAKDVTWVFRVVDPQGHPVTGARVNVWRADQTPASEQPGTTDAQGTGRLHLKPGQYSAKVQAPGFVTAFHEDIRIPPESTPRLDLPLVRSVPPLEGWWMGKGSPCRASGSGSLLPTPRSPLFKPSAARRASSPSRMGPELLRALPRGPALDLLVAPARAARLLSPACVPRSQPT
ncbi:carboxypeptidase-like regulatory domain-containing protein [Corallococcus sp. EGB]|uniref:carboxypeptidase-like regulatory domain-containing protein n=1 Tax=Corallococcus sp. EGB TaxID=1521117 RepID=UPI001CBD4330|nr:carboxypeptidase-like regulatory domain-containing protein [Corallococcus sp. EGB]